ERLFWIPEQGDPFDGVYVQYDLAEMLDVVAIECARAGAFVVGEDLGTVPPSMPTALAERGILSYRGMSLDPSHPATYPERCMAAVTTHALPTSVGLLSGRDLKAQLDLDLAPNQADIDAAVALLRSWTDTTADTDMAVAVAAVHRVLGGSPAELVVATLEDL